MHLHNGYQFEFNDETSTEHNVVVESRPDIPIGVEDVDFVTVSGRDTTITIRNGTYDDIKIKLECGFKVDDPDQWGAQVRKIRQWLTGSGKLTFSDSGETFYKVKLIEIDKVEREGRKYGHFEAEFTCDAFEYVHAGTLEYDLDDVLYNPYSKCKPVYLITGTGTCTLTVNGKTMTATVEGDVIIDTDLMLSYTSDGALVNTSVSGDYDGLWLKTGKNTISITSGFALKVVPNWRCM